jgi:hypothetical protein
VLGIRFPGKHLPAARADWKGGAENVDFDRTVPAQKERYPEAAVF